MAGQVQSDRTRSAPHPTHADNGSAGRQLVDALDDLANGKLEGRRSMPGRPFIVFADVDHQRPGSHQSVGLDGVDVDHVDGLRGHVFTVMEPMSGPVQQEIRCMGQPPRSINSIRTPSGSVQ